VSVGVWLDMRRGPCQAHAPRVRRGAQRDMRDELKRRDARRDMCHHVRRHIRQDMARVSNTLVSTTVWGLWYNVIVSM
jgi:hypothetical protein